MRDAFAVLFFVSVGMLFDPTALIRQPALVAATTAIVVLIKPLAALAIILLLRYPPKIAFGVAAALGQIGEFSFIVASLGVALGVLTRDAMNALVAASIVSITLNPLVYRASRPLEAWAAERPRLWRLLNARVRKPATARAASERDEARRADPRYRAVIVGYGPVGRTVSRLLRENEIEPTIIDLNLETVRSLRRQGIPGVYGDASRRETLEEAGVPRAGSLILSAGGIHGSEEVIRLARELNPRIRVLARSAYVRELDTLRDAGADTVFSGEGEVALAFTETVLRALGATPEQIDRERERVRRELSGSQPTDLTLDPDRSPANAASA